MSLTKRYILSFLKSGKLIHFFGIQLLIYSGILIAASIFAALTQMGISGFAPQMQWLIRLVFILSSAASLSLFMQKFFTGSLNEYLLSLRFSKGQLYLLSCMTTLPVLLANLVFFCLVLTDEMLIEERFVLTVVAALTQSALSYTFLWIQKQQVLLKRTLKPRALKKESLLRAFSSSSRAFFRKDLHDLRRFEMILCCILAIFIGIGVMLYANLTQGWQAFAVCFYIGIAVMLSLLPNGLYDRETAAMSYYRHQLRLSDMQIVMYKLPLQLLVLICFGSALLIFDVLFHGLSIQNIGIALGIVLYGAITCMALGWWLIKRLQKMKDFGILYMLPYFAVAGIPFIAIIYMLGTLLWPSLKLKPKKVN